MTCTKTTHTSEIQR